jgi:hypothetical protein
MLVSKSLAQNEILDRTKNYEGLSNLMTLDNHIIDKNILIEYIKNLLNSTEKIYYDKIPAPINDNVNYSVKGLRHKYLYDIIINNKVILIWHNKIYNVYEFWATSNKKLRKCINIIKRRIYKSEEYHSKKI